MKYDVIIIGGGAAGLLAMRHLLADGYHVCLLEAGTRAGGRIATVNDDDFNAPVETGAEFIHGNAPLTLQLLNEAGIAYKPVEAKMITVRNGQWLNESEPGKQWEQFSQEVDALETDMTIRDFLDTHFSGDEYAKLREGVRNFATGFILADITKGSVMQVKNEWDHQNETQYRIPGGYMQLIDRLLISCRQKNADIVYNAVVTKIDHTNGEIKIHTAANELYTASKVITTVSLGVLQSGNIEFVPALTSHAAAIQQIGFGSVIKILLWFQKCFWKKYDGDAGFFITDEIIPTWWTQDPIKSNMLTGWLGGPAALEKSLETSQSLLQSSLRSVASIFRLTGQELRQKLVQHKIVCWHNQPYSKGGYSYNTISSIRAKQILSSPVNNCIFFAGEAVWHGKSQGTVEAALQSGQAVAAMVRHY